MEKNIGAEVTFEGNNYDLSALAGAIFAGAIMISCVPGLSCLFPFIPAVLGIVGLLNVSQSVDPDRTRKLSWVGIGVSLLYMAVIFAFFALYLGFFFFVIAAEGNNFP